jgi:DNA-binding IclR family transcriptional regulator
MSTRALTSSLKTLEVLAALADSDRGMGVSELARRMGVSRGIVHRQLVTLCVGGWAEQAEDGTYRIGLRVARIADAAMRHAGLDSRAASAMEQLAAQLHEPVSLAVLDDGSARIVNRIDVDRDLRVELRVDQRMPLDKSASGRILCAYAPEHEIDRLRAAGIAIPPPSELVEIRAAGYAISTPGYQDETEAVAAAVFDARGQAIAALSVVAPRSRFDAAASTPPLVDCARRLTAMVSGRRAAA